VRRAVAVVAHFYAQLVGGVVQRHLGLRGAGVLEHVGETLLNDPVRGDVNTAGQRETLARDVQQDRKPGAFHVFE
jgi:hypothetical protein